VVLLPGYGRTAAQPVSGRQLEAIERALDGQAGVRAELARSLLAQIRDLGRRAAELERSIAALVAGHPLLALPGVGALTAARLVAETGDVARFRSPAAFAMLAGVAPIPASSGEVHRMRLNRGGNRRLNRALYTIALSQAWHHEPARAYIARKRASGKGRGAALPQAPGGSTRLPTAPSGPIRVGPRRLTTIGASQLPESGLASRVLSVRRASVGRRIGVRQMPIPK